MSNQHEKINTEEAAREYGFEDGATEAVRRIKELLRTQDCVVVGFSCPSRNAGKTKLSRALVRELSSQNIRVVTYKGLEEIRERFDPEYLADVSVITFEQLNWGSYKAGDYEIAKKYYDKIVTKASTQINKHVKGVDIWVGIYRPDKPFELVLEDGTPLRPLADLIIRNDQAEDK